MKISNILIFFIILVILISCNNKDNLDFYNNTNNIKKINNTLYNNISEKNNNLSKSVINKSNLNKNNTIEFNKSNNFNNFSNINSSLKEENSWYKPLPKITWQLQLNGDLNLVYDVDLYDIDLFDTSKEVIDLLHKRGIKIICYFSAGTYEDWRPDANKFPKEVLGNKLEDWEGERWLDISKYEKFKDIMLERLDLAVDKGCDGVDPDNIDAYTNPTGFKLTYNSQLIYNKWLAEEAHKRNLSIGLKNDLLQVKDLVDYFDFAINEQCFYYDECEYLLPFINQNKAVLGVEYELPKSDFCDKANKFNFSWLRMSYDLKGERDSCN